MKFIDKKFRKKWERKSSQTIVETNMFYSTSPAKTFDKISTINSQEFLVQPHFYEPFKYLVKVKECQFILLQAKCRLVSNECKA